MNNEVPQRDPLAKLVHEMSKLPTIGEKSAMRLAMHILKTPKTQAESLAQAILDVKTNIKICERCCSYTENSLCNICSDFKRSEGIIAVVETQSDLIAIERTGSFRGRYHVLHGVLSPLDGVGPDDLKILQFLKRFETNPPEEVILATNPSVEGEATAMYIAKLVEPLCEKIKITRLAYGLPVGGVLEYADRMSIGKAFENRVPLG